MDKSDMIHLRISVETWFHIHILAEEFLHSRAKDQVCGFVFYCLILFDSEIWTIR